MAGEIIGAEHRHHAMGTVPQDRAAERHGGLVEAGALRLGGDRYLDLADHGSHFAPTVPQQLAGLARDQDGEILGFIAQDLGKAARDRDALGQGRASPAGKGDARALHRGKTFRRAGRPTFPDGLAGRGIGGSQEHGIHSLAGTMSPTRPSGGVSASHIGRPSPLCPATARATSIRPRRRSERAPRRTLPRSGAALRRPRRG